MRLGVSKLALVQMRTICGSRKLGKEIELLRNKYLYQEKNISVTELHEIRKRQLKAKKAIQKLNAKYSLCTLVDIEYHVQILQVLHLKSNDLQITNIYKALNALNVHGVLSPKESLQLKKAHNFFARVINALRMLHGNANDLFLPSTKSIEFTRFTRRMGYSNDKLCQEWQTYTLKVRSFVEKHFGKNVLPFEENRHYMDYVQI